MRGFTDASAPSPQRGPDDYLPNVPTVAELGADVQNLLWRGCWTYANRGDMCINVLTLYQTDDGKWRGTIYIQTDMVSRVEDVSGHLIVLRHGAEAGMPSANVDPRAWITQEFLSHLAADQKPTQDAMVEYVCKRFGISREIARRFYAEVHTGLLQAPPRRGNPHSARK